MRTLVAVCNILLFVCVCLVLATEGAPRDGIYVAFTLALILIPLVTAFVLVRDRAGGARPNVTGSRTSLPRLAALGNIVLLGLVVLAMVDQYPHPDEPGFLAFVALTVVTPILSALVLMRNRSGTVRAARG
jgi:hypothetical protein